MFKTIIQIERRLYSHHNWDIGQQKKGMTYQRCGEFFLLAYQALVEQYKPEGPAGVYIPNKLYNLEFSESYKSILTQIEKRY